MVESGKKALVIGATGLVGSQLLQLLLHDKRFEKVVVFVRRTTGLSQPKLVEHIINFDRPETWQQLVNGDVLFSALGTTISKAKTQENQYKIDYTYQYNFARAAADNGVPGYVLISSAGADPSSRIFYSRMKGELEVTVKKLSIPHIHIIQPGLLTGDRNEFRLGERLAAPLLSFLQFIPPLKQYRPIHARTVAQAMVNASFDVTANVKTHKLEQVFKLGK